MGYGVVHAVLAACNHRRVIEQIAELEDAVGVVGGLLVAPPAFTMSRLTLNLAVPERRVIWI